MHASEFPPPVKTRGRVYSRENEQPWEVRALADLENFFESRVEIGVPPFRAVP